MKRGLGIALLVGAGLVIGGWLVRDPDPYSGGVFFPRWSAPDAPTAIVTGRLIRRDDCLFISRDTFEWLVVWEESYSFKDDSILDSSGKVVGRVGEDINGGGGYFEPSQGTEEERDDLWRQARAMAEGTDIPQRCHSDDGWVLIYAVEPGLFS